MVSWCFYVTPICDNRHCCGCDHCLSSDAVNYTWCYWYLGCCASSKKVNDTYGHVVGDEVIRHISKLIRQHVRETDVSGRYGGEEFSILLADTPLEKGKVFAERLRKEIEESTVKYNDIDLKYTVSMGIAEIESSIDSYETWIKYADTALYQSKKDGKNKVSLHAKQ